MGTVAPAQNVGGRSRQSHPHVLYDPLLGLRHRGDPGHGSVRGGAPEHEVQSFRDQRRPKTDTSLAPGGNVTAQFTELVLPGKNHFDLVLNRIYDSSVACVDASTKTAVYTNDGDSPWYLGQGWRFDFPWMKWNGSGLWIKGLDAQIISADQGSMATSHNGSSIVATLTVHESVDIVFQATFVQSVQYTASNYGPPSQNITYAFASGNSYIRMVARSTTTVRAA